MSNILIGSVLNKAPDKRYCRSLRFAELDIREPLPRPSTLRRWRFQVSSNTVFSLKAPGKAIVSDKGPLRIKESLEQWMDWTLEAADALNVQAVVLCTPSNFTTSQKDRDLLAAYRERLPNIEGRIWVWEPSGLWEEEDSYPLAEQLDLICAFDPLKSTLPPNKIAYARIRALGINSHISDSMLHNAIDLLSCQSLKKAYLSITSHHSVQHAIQAQKLVASE